MSSIALTYDQAASIGQLVRDERPVTIMVGNPRDVGRCAVFVSFEAEDGTLTQHTVETDGCVASTLTVAA